jgi:hypothetical protein
VANIFAIAASRVTRAAPRVLLPRRAIRKQRRRVDAGRHVGELRLRHLEVGERLAEHAAAARPGERLVERAAREAEGCTGDRGAKDVQAAHRQLEALACLAEELRA